MIQTLSQQLALNRQQITVADGVIEED